MPQHPEKAQGIAVSRSDGWREQILIDLNRVGVTDQVEVFTSLEEAQAHARDMADSGQELQLAIIDMDGDGTRQERDDLLLFIGLLRELRELFPHVVLVALQGSGVVRSQLAGEVLVIEKDGDAVGRKLRAAITTALTPEN